MESTDRMQVRDLIEKLQQFDTKARITGEGFEIRDVSKSDDSLVYIDTTKSDEVTELESEVEYLESEVTELESEVEDLESVIEDLREEIAELKADKK